MELHCKVRPEAETQTNHASLQKGGIKKENKAKMKTGINGRGCMHPWQMSTTGPAAGQAEHAD
jgi:hypothetical protein